MSNKMVNISVEEYQNIIQRVAVNHKVSVVSAVVTTCDPEMLAVLVEPTNKRDISNFMWDVQIAMDNISEKQLKDVDEGRRIVPIANVIVNENQGLMRFKQFVQSCGFRRDTHLIGARIYE